MRLTPDEITAIKRTVADLLGSTAEVRLFGSRVDDRRRGGDVDLHVVADDAVVTGAMELRLGDRLEVALGDQKVDVVLRGRSEPQRPIDRIALEQGVLL